MFCAILKRYEVTANPKNERYQIADILSSLDHPRCSRFGWRVFPCRSGEVQSKFNQLTLASFTEILSNSQSNIYWVKSRNKKLCGTDSWVYVIRFQSPWHEPRGKVNYRIPLSFPSQSRSSKKRGFIQYVSEYVKKNLMNNYDYCPCPLG